MNYRAAALTALVLAACGSPSVRNPEAGAPLVQTEALGLAVAAATYEQQLEAAAGVPPLVWSLTDVPAELGWLQLDPASGRLTGTPPTFLMPGINFTAVVTDARGRTSSRTLKVTVLECAREAEQNDCFYSTGGACMQSTVLCSNGRLPSCSGGAGSRSTIRCGDGCGTCSTTSADACDGSCRCGGGPACSGTAGTCCGGGCVDVLADTSNCGACGTVCPASGPENSHPSCTAAGCGWDCNPGFTRCGDACVNAQTDASNCGACGIVCASTCSGGACVTSCNTAGGFQACGTSCIQVASDVDNCGACGTVCPAGPTGSTRRCSAGQCGWACNAGLTNCSGACVNTSTNASHCGGCGATCSGAGPIGSIDTCSAGSCNWRCPSTTPYCAADDACETTTACNGGGGTCFTSGTPVLLADGSARAIETLSVGDLVLSYDTASGELEAGRVTRTLVHPDTPGLLRVNGELVTTPEHAFFVGGGWRRADSLRPGDLLLGASLAPGFGGRPTEAVPVVSLESLDGGVTTYNLEVEGWHVYFAGGVLVHNAKCTTCQIP